MAQGFEESQEDRTETATSFRREEFRKQGVVAQSREVLSVALFLVAGGTLSSLASGILTHFSTYADKTFRFGAIVPLDTKNAQEILLSGLSTWGLMVWPLLAAVVVAGLVGGVSQVGFHISTEPLTPNFDRINPVKGFQRLLSLDSAIEALKAFIKMLLIFGVSWVFLKQRAFEAGHYFNKSVAEVTPLILGDVMRLFFIIAGVLAVFAAGDFFYQRYRIEKQMRMTKREVKEEYKLREGDPLMKSRIRNVQRRLARRRMLEAVPKADVIVTNPTHYSIAIQYDPERMNAPRVVAKGVDFLALKIREIAKGAGVPLVENKLLARTLYRQIPVGKTITKDLYAAVAQVLSYVYRLRARTSSATA